MSYHGKSGSAEGDDQTTLGGGAGVGGVLEELFHSPWPYEMGWCYQVGRAAMYRFGGVRVVPCWYAGGSKEA